MKLSQQQEDTLKLLLRSPDRGDGWRTCSPVLFEQLILPMPNELLEKDSGQLRVRLTDKGQTLAEWII